MGFVCQLCHERGHIALQCHKNKKCQLCYKFGHIALQCHKLIRCQLCSGVNHTAATCHSRPTQSKTTTSNTLNDNNKPLNKLDSDVLQLVSENNLLTQIY